jgi:hypothetical protein
MEHLPFLKGHSGVNLTPGGTKTLVDLRPWQTAETLAPLAVTSEETEYAHQAEHLADHEVDQAFASALRLANMRIQGRALTGDALALSQKVAQLQQLVQEDQAQVKSLTQAAGASSQSTASADDSNNSGDDLDIAKAQLGLDSDQLADAQQDLARASGDDRAQIQSELTEHEEVRQRTSQRCTRGCRFRCAVRHSRGTMESVQQAADSLSVDTAGQT